MYSPENVPIQTQLVTWVNGLGLCEGKEKADSLKKIAETLIYSAPEHIDEHLDTILTNGYNKNTEVKKQVIQFMEDLSKWHPKFLPKVMGELRSLLDDEVVAVQKRVIQASGLIYRHITTWYSSVPSPQPAMKYVWDQFCNLKLQILNMIDSDNEGIRTLTMKFLEEVVLIQTPSYGVCDNDDQDYSLDKVPNTFSFIDRKTCAEEAQHIFNLLLKFHNSQHISSVNLMACMTTLCTVAKYRNKFMPKVIQALADLHTTLPPTLSQSQVNSVRKHLKMLIVNIIKFPSANDMLPQWSQLLLDIGMTMPMINKLLPKEKRFKRLSDIKNVEPPPKRSKLDTMPPAPICYDVEKSGPTETKVADTPEPLQPTPLSEESLYRGLCSVENVVALVTDTLVKHLPEELPKYFTTLYKPIPNAGSSTQKRNLSKLLYSLATGQATRSRPATQPQTSLSDIAAKLPIVKEPDEKLTLKNAVAKLQESTKVEKQIEESISKILEKNRQEFLQKDEKKDDKKRIPPPTPTVPKLKQKVKLLKLQEITRPIPRDIKEKLISQAVTRILGAEHDANVGGVARIRAKLITTFASSYTAELRELVLAHILADPANRTEVAIAWLYEEYAFMQGFSRHPVTLQPKFHEKHDQNYNQLLCALITQIAERDDPAMESSKDELLRKIYYEAPYVTDEAIDYLKHLVSQERYTILALEVLETICIMRPPRAHKYVVGLLANALNENESIRSSAITAIVKVYRCSAESVKKIIEKYAKVYLGFIVLSSPPLDLFPGDSRVKHKWTEELYNTCINLVMALFPENEDVIIEIASVYGGARAEAKRSVLRAVEAPVRARVAACPGTPRALLALLDECPRGAETLLTRLLHVLTDRSPPSPELVSRVRDLYATRVSDVRFLIPVLNGLTKKEILAALPKLIKLNPVVVQEVFNKLLGLHSGDARDDKLPLSPAALLVALHLIDPNKAELKYIIKATVLCFAEKQIYTEDVVSEVIERLVAEPEIPVLMMRSVLQALTLYPGMAPRMLHILQHLVDKEVWSNKVAWEGWIKCCERTLPASVGILMSLPTAPLAACLSSAPALAGALAEHVQALSPEQRAALPPALLADLTPLLAAYAPPSQYQEEPFVSSNLPSNPIEPLPPGME